MSQLQPRQLPLMFVSSHVPSATFPTYEIEPGDRVDLMTDQEVRHM